MSSNDIIINLDVINDPSDIGLTKSIVAAILGLALTQLVSRVAVIIDKKISIECDHILWLIFSFLFTIQFWYGIGPYVINKPTFLTMLFVVLDAIFIAFANLLILPETSEIKDPKKSLKGYLYRPPFPFFLSIIANILLTAGLNLKFLADKGCEDIIVRALGIFILFSAMTEVRHEFRKFIPMVALGLFSYWLIVAKFI